MITGSTRWFEVGAYLVNAVRDGLTVKVARAGQVPGSIAWDDCNCDGLLAVTAPRIYLSERFPDEAEGPLGGTCRAPYEVADFTVSVLRCAPQPQGQELSPKVSELSAAALRLLTDIAETMDALAALLCSLKDEDIVSDYFVTPAESAGPEGSCVGFTLRVLIALDRL